MDFDLRALCFYTSCNLLCLHRLCLNDCMIILSMYKLFGLCVVCKATLRNKRMFVSRVRKRRKKPIHPPSSRYALSYLTTFVYFHTARDLLCPCVQHTPHTGYVTWHLLIGPKIPLLNSFK